MLRENILTAHLIKTLQRGGLSKITTPRSVLGKNVELRREVGNNSFIADILISLSSKKEAMSVFDTKKTQFIAIEVKISDWKQGLYQAWRYYSFAEKSYLALYKDFAKNIDLEIFKEYNVGLIIFDEESIEILHRPVKNKFKKENIYELDLRETIWKRSLTIESVQPSI